VHELVQAEVPVPAALVHPGDVARRVGDPAVDVGVDEGEVLAVVAVVALGRELDRGVAEAVVARGREHDVSHDDIAALGHVAHGAIPAGLGGALLHPVGDVARNALDQRDGLRVAVGAVRRAGVDQLHAVARGAVADAVGRLGGVVELRLFLFGPELGDRAPLTDVLARGCGIGAVRTRVGGSWDLDAQAGGAARIRHQPVELDAARGVLGPRGGGRRGGGPRRHGQDGERRQ